MAFSGATLFAQTRDEREKDTALHAYCLCTLLSARQTRYFVLMQPCKTAWWRSWCHQRPHVLLTRPRRYYSFFYNLKIILIFLLFGFHLFLCVLTSVPLSFHAQALLGCAFCVSMNNVACKYMSNFSVLSFPEICSRNLIAQIRLERHPLTVSSLSLCQNLFQFLVFVRHEWQCCPPNCCLLSLLVLLLLQVFLIFLSVFLDSFILGHFNYLFALNNNWILSAHYNSPLLVRLQS